MPQTTEDLAEVVCIRKATGVCDGFQWCTRVEQHACCFLNSEVGREMRRGQPGLLAKEMAEVTPCSFQVTNFKRKKVEKEIEEDTYRSSLLLDMLVTISILVVGIFLVFYLIHSA